MKSKQAAPDSNCPAMASVMSGLAARPDKLFQAQADLFSRYMDLWSSTAGQMQAATSAGPRPDKRFKDPAWSENPTFDIMRRSYQLSADWMNELVSSVEDIDPRTKRRAEFFTRLLTDAFSPSNFLASNPAALKALAETIGASGLTHPKDLKPDHLMIRINAREVRSARSQYDWVEPGELLDHNVTHPAFAKFWDMARADSFAAAV